VLTIVGVILYLYVATELEIGAMRITRHPYQDMGTLLLALGIIIVVAGGIVMAIQSKSPYPLPRQVLYGPPPALGPPNPAGFCTYCGASLRPIDVWCPSCGRKTLK
jgi:hypothetical protein